MNFIEIQYLLIAYVNLFWRDWTLIFFWELYFQKKPLVYLLAPSSFPSRLANRTCPKFLYVVSAWPFARFVTELFLWMTGFVGTWYCWKINGACDGLMSLVSSRGLASTICSNLYKSCHTCNSKTSPMSLMKTHSQTPWLSIKLHTSML